MYTVTNVHLIGKVGVAVCSVVVYHNSNLGERTYAAEGDVALAVREALALEIQAYTTQCLALRLKGRPNRSAFGGRLVEIMDRPNHKLRL